jgi:CheY-like chemotaxis protein
MSTRKILLVDDSKSARYALRLLLQRHSCDVDTAESAESALEKVQAALPDAIFMDHLMPGMNGFEALDVLKGDSRTAHIPVVMCTSNDDVPYQLQAKEKGALGILPKPATPDSLQAMLEAVDTAIAESRAAAAPEEAEKAEEAEIVLEMPAAAPPSEAEPAFDAAKLSEIVKEQMQSMFAQELAAPLQSALAASLPAIKEELSNTLGQQAAEQIKQPLNAELTKLRQELNASTSGDSALAQKIDADMRQFKNDLIRMETEHAQTVANKLSREVLPELINKQTERLAQQLSERFELRLGEVAEKLLNDIPNNSQLLRRVSDAAETAAEQKAIEIAGSQARDIAINAAEQRAGEVTDSLIHTAKAAVGRMYLLAALAAIAGIGAAAVVYVLLS